MIVENNDKQNNLGTDNSNNNSNFSKNHPNSGEFKPWGMEKRQFLTLLHLSQFAGYISAGLGFIVPVVMWLMFREQDADVDAHGKEITNFTISVFIYLIISFLLAFFLIGFFLIFALAIVNIIFTIMGALKAQEGVLYRYPLTIRFFK